MRSNGNLKKKLYRIRKSRFFLESVLVFVMKKEQHIPLLQISEITNNKIT